MGRDLDSQNYEAYSHSTRSSFNNQPPLVRREYQGVLSGILLVKNVNQMNNTTINQGTSCAHAVINNRRMKLNGGHFGMRNHEGLCNLTYKSLKHTLNNVDISYNRCNCCSEKFYVLFLLIYLHSTQKQE